MSLFEITTDDVVTVNEALAFIDSFDSQLSTDCSTDSGEAHVSPQAVNSPYSSSSPSVDTALSTQKKPRPAAPKRKKKPNPPGYTTRVQRQKRAELQSLRDEARALEARFDLLKNLPTDSHTGQAQVAPKASSCQSKWSQLVEIERSRRRSAEETNRRLRGILRQYFEANKMLRRVLEKKTLLKEIDVVFNDPAPPHSFTAFANRTAITGHLEELVGELYIRAGSVFESWPSTMSYSMCFKFDQKRGKVAEMRAITPVASPMEAAADILWQEQSGQRPDPQKWARRMRGRLPNSQEKNWVLTLQCQSYLKQVTGIQLLQKFQERDRIVLVRTDLITLNGEGLQFRDMTWTTITRSETDPKRACVVRIFEEIFMDCQDGFNARAEDVAYAQNVVLKNISWKLNDCTRKLQDALMEKF